MQKTLTNFRKRRCIFYWTLSVLIMGSLVYIYLFINGERRNRSLTQLPSSSHFPSLKASLNIRREDKYNWDYSGNFSQEYKQFAPGLNATEYDWYLELIKVFTNICESFNITYLLEGGTVLGAYRYHGFVPWDDDFDVRVNRSHRDILKKALEALPMHTILTPKFYTWKLYNNKNSIRTPYKWNWPFIDIFFFNETKTQIFDSTTKEPKKFDPIGDIFPLEYAVFENMVLPVPRNMEAYLKRKYDLQNPCKSNAWDHKRERSPRGGPRNIPCEHLFNVYPLVHRFHRKRGFPYEEFRLGNRTLYKIQRLFI